MNNILYFSNPQIVLQEVPNEISLALSISGCPLGCKGCHSAFTWKNDYGEELTNEKLIGLIQKNPHISCVLFYGGEWREKRLLELLSTVKGFNLKTCLYTGFDLEEVSKNLKTNVDYLKVGRYVEELGGLSSKTTNQRMYDMNLNKDITDLFWR